MSFNKHDDFRIDFVGIGAEKSGTSWLANNLRKHPLIFIPSEKELHYFNRFAGNSPETPNNRYNQSLKWYHSFFKQANEEQIVGEVTPAYMKNENCAIDIFNYNPEIKLLIILRAPVHRAYSSYLFRSQLGLYNYPSFDEAINKRPELLSSSQYYRQLKPFFDVFPRENIKVMFFRDLKNNNRGLLKDLCMFLNVKEFCPEDIDHKANPTKIVRFRILNTIIYNTFSFTRNNPAFNFVPAFLKKTGLMSIMSLIQKLNTRPMDAKPEISKGLETRLKKYFKDDIENLENLLNRDLSDWK